MKYFDQIKSNFSFLEKEHDFKIIEEKKYPISAHDYEFEVVSYLNDFVMIEIGGGDGLTGSAIDCEIRKHQNGSPVPYHHSTDAINYRLLIELNSLSFRKKFEDDSGFDRLANLIKQNMNSFKTDQWFLETFVKGFKDRVQIIPNKTLVEVEKANKGFLNERGFIKVKSNQTVSSFEHVDNEFFTYSNGEKELTVTYEFDLKDQYSCYHIIFTGEELQGVFPKRNRTETVSSITEIVRRLVLNIYSA